MPRSQQRSLPQALRHHISQQIQLPEPLLVQVLPVLPEPLLQVLALRSFQPPTDG